MDFNTLISVSVIINVTSTLRAQSAWAAEYTDLSLKRGMKPHNIEDPGYDIKPSDSEASTLDIL